MVVCCELSVPEVCNELSSSFTQSLMLWKFAWIPPSAPRYWVASSGIAEEAWRLKNFESVVGIV